MLGEIKDAKKRQKIRPSERSRTLVLQGKKQISGRLERIRKSGTLGENLEARGDSVIRKLLKVYQRESGSPGQQRCWRIRGILKGLVRKGLIYHLHRKSPSNCYKIFMLDVRGHLHVSCRC
jgi:hypothetical protein